jgi:hypothetical protein
MWLILEILVTPIFYILNITSEIKYHLGRYGIGPKANIYNPNWWLEINKDRDLIFTKSKNNRKKKVYELLKSNPEGVDKYEIIKKVKIKYDDLRSDISQLRRDLMYQRIYKEIIVEKGKYKIIEYNRKFPSDLS